MRRMLEEISRNAYDKGMKSVVSEKGQVTIPKALRESLGIKPGVELDFEEVEGTLVATKVVVRDAFEEVWGIVALDHGTDEYVRMMRDPLE